MTSPGEPPLPALVALCDWSKSSDRRWVSYAIWRDGCYTAHPPQLVDEPTTLLDRLRDKVSASASLLVGFDFPIGLPKAFADRAKISEFRTFLKELGKGKWKEFCDVCREPSEISIYRPFYPYNSTPKGSRKRSHLVDGLQLTHFDDLLRTCERPQPGIPAAGSLFWTLGAKAPGRAAIHGWSTVIAPSLDHPQIKLWPFDGPLHELLQPGNTVLAEAYPTQYHRSILKTQFSGKGNQGKRKEQAPHLCAWARKHKVHLQSSLLREIQAGFPQGDNAFDAVLGLFGLLEVAIGVRPDGYPTDPNIRSPEGWILGQP